MFREELTDAIEVRLRSFIEHDPIYGMLIVPDADDVTDACLAWIVVSRE
jgi:hypothetical protein